MELSIQISHLATSNSNSIPGQDGAVKGRRSVNSLYIHASSRSGIGEWIAGWIKDLRLNPLHIPYTLHFRYSFLDGKPRGWSQMYSGTPRHTLNSCSSWEGCGWWDMHLSPPQSVASGGEWIRICLVSRFPSTWIAHQSAEWAQQFEWL